MRTFALVLGGLLLWAPRVRAQRPSDADAAAMVEHGRVKALAYAKSLPDFMCTEVIRRFREGEAPGQTRSASHSDSGTFVLPGNKEWIPTDKLTVRLGFFQQKEEHQLVLLDDKPTELTYEAMTGATVKGELGGMLQNIFDPASQTVFRWESWKKARGHRIAVYRYLVLASHSQYLLANGTPGDIRSAIVGFHGVLELDSETGELIHVNQAADHIPGDLKLQNAFTTVDYDTADVGGRDYLLPVRSATEMSSVRVSVRNETEFRDYHKFSASSVIDFAK